MYSKYAQIRDTRGLKDFDIAKLLSIPTSTLSEWKNGKYTPKYDKLKKIADFLGCTVEDFMQ